jgi:hypothetical protein
MTKSVDLMNGRKWKKQADALQHFKEMLGRYSSGANVDDPADHDDLAALLLIYDTHVAAGEPTKAGSGIANFSKQVNRDNYNSPSFHVHRTDGTSIDFSYIKAVQFASK